MVDCAAILAGGFGTRLRPAVSDRPKVLAEVAGRPFIVHLLDRLAGSGIRRVVLCTGYLAAMVRDALGERYRGVELVYSVEESPLGTGGALGRAAGLLSGETVLVQNGDSWCECDLADFAARRAAAGAPAAMALARVDNVGRFGAVLTDDRSMVSSLTEKGGEEGSGWINAGLYLLPKRFVEEIPPGRQLSLERELFPGLLSQGVYGYRCSGSFIDIGVPEEYRRAQLLFSPEQEGRS